MRQKVIFFLGQARQPPAKPFGFFEGKLLEFIADFLERSLIFQALTRPSVTLSRLTPVEGKTMSLPSPAVTREKVLKAG